MTLSNPKEYNEHSWVSDNSQWNLSRHYYTLFSSQNTVRWATIIKNHGISNPKETSYLKRSIKLINLKWEKTQYMYFEREFEMSTGLIPKLHNENLREKPANLYVAQS